MKASHILHWVLLGDDAVCAFVTKRESTAATLSFVEQHLVEHRCVFGEYNLHSFTVTDNAQGPFAIGKECDLVQIVFDDGLVNYGQAQIIRNQAFNINAQGIIAPGFVDIRSYDGFTEFFQLIV